MTSPISWGIIGCGNVTEVKSGPAFNLVEGSKLTAVMRRNAEKARDYAQRHNVPKWYGDADQLLNDPDINAVYIATPPVFHKEFAIKALAKGLHVYVEKPVTLNAKEAEEIANASKHSSAKIVVAHYRRRLPAFLFVKELLEKKAIGEVRLVQISMWQSMQPDLVAKTEENWRVNPKISGGGLFHDLSPHQLDLMLYYFGGPVKCSGFSLNQSKQNIADDTVCGQMLFKNNILFTGIWNFCAAEHVAKDECIIIGSNGSISFSFFGSGDVTVRGENGKEERHHFEHPRHIQQPMIQSVVNYFKGSEENPCTIDEGISVMKMIDAFTMK